VESEFKFVVEEDGDGCEEKVDGRVEELVAEDDADAVDDFLPARLFLCGLQLVSLGERWPVGGDGEVEEPEPPETDELDEMGDHELDDLLSHLLL